MPSLEVAPTALLQRTRQSTNAEYTRRCYVSNSAVPKVTAYTKGE